MGSFHVHTGGRQQAIAPPGFVTVQQGASAHTKGAYVQVFASTDFDWKSMAIFLQNDPVGGAVLTSGLLDIAIGGAGSEQIILANLLTSNTPVSLQSIYVPLMWHHIPVNIPAGTRISARSQLSAAGSLNSYLVMVGYAGGMPNHPAIGRSTTLGVNTGTTRGVTVTTGAANGTKGSWAEISSSAPHDIRYLGFIASFRDHVLSVVFDIGIGGAGSEVVLVPDIQVGPWCPAFNVYPVSIPAGTRIAMRSAAAFSGGVGRPLDVALVAMG
jgi:hypothetical protein